MHIVKDIGKPEPGKVYSLTGLGKSIANGGTWAEAEVPPEVLAESAFRSRCAARPMRADVRPDCQSWPGGVRCRNRSAGILIQPDGQDNPGGAICQSCADAVITEYREKLGERWGLAPWCDPAPEFPRFSRDEAIARIRAGLRKRSGKAWSVTGGRGTGWGWIRIDAPPARRTWHNRPKNGQDPNTAPPGREGWEEYDGGKPDGFAGPEDRAELARLLGKETIHEQGESIPAGSDYYAEYVARAEGREPEVYGVPYWD